MPKFSIPERAIGIAGLISGVLLIVLDKAEKLKGPVLYVLLALAALMTLPLAVGIPWVSKATSKCQKLSRKLLMGLCVALVYCSLLIWIWPDHSQERFCYFSVFVNNGKPLVKDGQYQLALNGVGVVERVNYWISPWGVESTGGANDPYYSLDVRKPLIEIVHAGGHAWDRFLPVGKYRIDFNSKNGNWYERLEIYTEGGVVKTKIKVSTRPEGGDVLYDSE